MNLAQRPDEYQIIIIALKLSGGDGIGTAIVTFAIAYAYAVGLLACR